MMAGNQLLQQDEHMQLVTSSCPITNRSNNSCMAASGVHGVLSALQLTQDAQEHHSNSHQLHSVLASEESGCWRLPCNQTCVARSAACALKVTSQLICQSH